MASWGEGGPNDASFLEFDCVLTRLAMRRQVQQDPEPLGLLRPVPLRLRLHVFGEPGLGPRMDHEGGNSRPMGLPHHHRLVVDGRSRSDLPIPYLEHRRPCVERSHERAGQGLIEGDGERAAQQVSWWQIAVSNVSEKQSSVRAEETFKSEPPSWISIRTGRIDIVKPV